MDDSSTQERNGTGILLTSLERQIYQYGLRFGFPATNNVAEYEALMAGLRLAEALKIYLLQVHINSQLIVG